MNITERYNLQKGKEQRFYSKSNTENTATDNYILNRIKIKKTLAEKQEQKEIDKQIRDTAEKTIKAEISKVFNEIMK